MGESEAAGERDKRQVRRRTTSSASMTGRIPASGALTHGKLAPERPGASCSTTATFSSTMETQRKIRYGAPKLKGARGHLKSITEQDINCVNDVDSRLSRYVISFLIIMPCLLIASMFVKLLLLMLLSTI